MANPARSKFHAAVLRRAVRVEDRCEQPCELVRDRRRRRRPHRYGRDGPAIVGDRAGMAEQAEAAVSKPFPFGGWGSTPRLDTKTLFRGLGVHLLGYWRFHYRAPLAACPGRTFTGWSSSP